MAQTNAHQDSTARPINPMLLCLEGCKTDDVSLIDQAMAIAAQRTPRWTVQGVLDRALKSSAARGAVHVLQYVLDRGADIHELTAETLLANDEMWPSSREVLEILVARGWDINTQGRRHQSWPLLWLVTNNYDLVKWCLDHGASVDVPEDPPTIHPDGTQSRSGRPRPTILGTAAFHACVETFELLRANNAPLDPRTLHRAVYNATLLSPDEGSDERSVGFELRMQMVRHLVDVVKIDVNTVAHEVGSYCSTPLCFPAARPTKQNFQELVLFLLERGADPDLGGVVDTGTTHEYRWMSPNECADHFNNDRFLRIVHEWKSFHDPKGDAG